MKAIIDVENLGKHYRIGASEAPYDTVREALMRALRAPFQRKNDKSSGDTIWALYDLSFQAMPGDVIGIIGHNGAGKSTLLKILSRVTEPTTGRADLYGRVGSLLEVGTGFHGELTGRENIYLNGAILGMRRVEIKNWFDEIVSFAEVERFIDTPVKRYSTGMYLRLAFAVAAFLESEILLVDEVLAVGDACFQKRCLGKMRDVSSSGRTVLLVSHNLAAIEALCNRCLLISQGRLLAEGKPSAIITRYLSAHTNPASASKALVSHPGRRKNLLPIMRRVTLFSESNVASPSVRMGAPFSVRVTFQSEARPIRPVFGLVFKNSYGVPVFSVSNRVITEYLPSEAMLAGTVSCEFESLPLMPGIYQLDLYLGDEFTDYDWIYEAISFEVLAADILGSGRLPPASDGPVFWHARWSFADATELADAPV